MTIEYRTDKAGFPIETCGRCAGMGRIPAYGNVHGGVCFKCAGAGAVWPSGRIAKLASTYYAQVRAMRSATAATIITWDTPDAQPRYFTGVQVGDELRAWRTNDPWRRVASVRTTAELNGWGSAGTMVHFTMRIVVTFEDGSSFKGWGETWTRRVGDRLDPARREAVAEATRLYERRLARLAR